MSVKNFFSNYWSGLLVVLLSLIFFLLASSFNYYTQSPDFVKWISPDETANYIMTKLYAQEGRLSIYEKYNQQMSDIIRPRSFRSDFGILKPMSFLGIVIVFGSLAKAIGVQAIPFMTPAFAAIGLAFYYLLLKRLFNKNVALLSAAILAFFPVYVYYSMRSMFHNVLFVVFFIISLWAGVEMVQERRRDSASDPAIPPTPLLFRPFTPLQLLTPFINYFLALIAGLASGLAIATRTSEFLWFGPLLVLLWLGNIRRVGILKLVLFVFGIVLAYAPIYHFNQALYDSPWRGGYAEMNKSISVITGASKDLVASPVSMSFWQAKKAAIQAIFDNLFVFGFKTYQSLRYLYYYFFKMFWWLAAGAFLGIIFFAMKAIWRFVLHPFTPIKNPLIPFYHPSRFIIKKRHILYLLGWVLSSAVLVFYYGSWKFNDNPDPKAFTIGNSYTRYWLPLYMGAIPLLSYAIIFISKIFTPLSYPLDKGGQGGFEGGRGRWPEAGGVVDAVNPENGSNGIEREEGDKAEAKFFSFRFDCRYLSFGFTVIAFAIIALWSLFYLYFGSSEGIAYVMHKQYAAREEGRAVLSATPSDAVIITRYHDKLFFPQRKVIVGLFNDDNMNRHYGELCRIVPTYYYNFTLPIRDLNYLNRRRLPQFGFRLEAVQEITSDFTLYKLETIK